MPPPWRCTRRLRPEGRDRQDRLASTPLSGPFANVGQNQLKSWQFVAEQLSGARTRPASSSRSSAFDNKSSPQESAERCSRPPSTRASATSRRATARASAVPLISTPSTKHNERNPGKEVVYLNYAAVDPGLTNEKCSFWHFRLDADTSMKMEALTTFMKDQPKHQEGLPDQPELLARPAGRASTSRKTWRASARTSRSSATTCTRSARSRTSRPTSPRSSSRAPTPSSPATGART